MPSARTRQSWLTASWCRSLVIRVKLRARSRHMRWRSFRRLSSLFEIAQDPRDLEQAPGRHAVDAAFVLVGLLIGHADHLRELLLGQSQHGAPLANALTDILLDVLDVCSDCFHSTSPFRLGVAYEDD